MVRRMNCDELKQVISFNDKKIKEANVIKAHTKNQKSMKKAFKKRCK